MPVRIAHLSTCSLVPQVRRLGEFHPTLSKNTEPDGQDIDDPLYGNVGGEEEQVGA